MSSLELATGSDRQVDNSDDINDVFEDIFLGEERIIDESYSQGLEDGRQEQSVKEAFDLGHKKAAEIGQEIGFYQTIVAEVATKQPEVQTNEKAKTILTETLNAIENFPRDNATDVDFLHNLQVIRNKYRRLCAVLKLPYRYTQTNVLSF